MTEEKITKAVIGWLQENGWEIVCFDFPQSGTGRVLHPNAGVRENTKNKGGIIPDIVAVRGGIAVFFENKDRYLHSDFKKVQNLCSTNDYSDAIDALLSDHRIQSITYGVGGPDETTFIDRAFQSRDMIDFIVVTDGVTAKVVYDGHQSF